MKDVLKELGSFIRARGFKGSGQNFRKIENDYVFVINIQGSRNGDVFFVNLGAQPAFVPAEGDAALPTIKEHECIMRMRVGSEWPWSLSGESVFDLTCAIDAAQSEFFGRVRTLRTAIFEDSVEQLIQEFSAGTTNARAALHLSRAALALGRRDSAAALVEYGLSIAGDRATGLIYDLKAVKSAAA